MILDPAQSHLDHGATAEQMAYVLERFQHEEKFFIATFVMPKELGTLPCSLYGPVMWDAPITDEECVWKVRGGRKWATRIVKDRKPRPVRQITVIGGPDDDGICILYTAYGGPTAPREPGDLTLAAWDDVLEARAFWAQHALCEG